MNCLIRFIGVIIVPRSSVKGSGNIWPIGNRVQGSRRLLQQRSLMYCKAPDSGSDGNIFGRKCVRFARPWRFVGALTARGKIFKSDNVV